MAILNLNAWRPSWKKIKRLSSSFLKKPGQSTVLKICIWPSASMSMLNLFESRYTLNGRYSIGNVGKTASMSMLILFESNAYSHFKYSLWLEKWIKKVVLLLRACFRKNGILCTSQSQMWSKAEKIAYQKYLLSIFLWLPAKLSYKMYAIWLVVYFKLLSKNICLAKWTPLPCYIVVQMSHNFTYTIIVRMFEYIFII